MQLAQRAVRDLRKLPGNHAQRIRQGLEAVAAGVATDVKRLAGRAPWLRLRVGDYRILFRPLTHEEAIELPEPGHAFLVARVVNRRELERAIERFSK